MDDADTTGKVNGLDVRAISLAALAANAPVPTITFENDVGSLSPLANLRLAVGIQNTGAGALVTDIKTDNASRQDANYKGDIVLKGDVTTDNAPTLIAEQLITDPAHPSSITWNSGNADFKLRLVGGSNTPLPSNLHLVAPGSNSNNSGGGGSGGTNTNSTDLPSTEAGKQWLMDHRSTDAMSQVASGQPLSKLMAAVSGQMVGDVQVGSESTATTSAFVQVRQLPPALFAPQQHFTYKLPADTFLHRNANEWIKLTASLANGSALPSWLKFSPKDARFSGTPPKGIQSLEVEVSATDSQGQRVTTRVRLVFSNGARR